MAGKKHVFCFRLPKTCFTFLLTRPQTTVNTRTRHTENASETGVSTSGQWKIKKHDFTMALLSRRKIPVLRNMFFEQRTRQARNYAETSHFCSQDVTICLMGCIMRLCSGTVTQITETTTMPQIVYTPYHKVKSLTPWKFIICPHVDSH